MLKLTNQSKACLDLLITQSILMLNISYGQRRGLVKLCKRKAGGRTSEGKGEMRKEDDRITSPRQRKIDGSGKKKALARVRVWGKSEGKGKGKIVTVIDHLRQH